MAFNDTTAATRRNGDTHAPDDEEECHLIPTNQRGMVSMATSGDQQCPSTVKNINEISNQVMQQSSNVQNVQMTFNFERAENMVFGAGGHIIKMADEECTASMDRVAQTLETQTRQISGMSQELGHLKERRSRDPTRQTCLANQTKAWIEERKAEQTYVPTKALVLAKEMISKNKLLIIRGNSGDGKTRLAVELLDWLMTGQDTEGDEAMAIPRKEPICLPGVKSWDTTVVPNSQLAILFDDMFGYGSESQREIDRWKKRESFIKPCLAGNMKDNANCLIITIRNDIYNEHRSALSSQGIFSVDNIIDLSSPEYLLQEEKKSLLYLYTLRLSDFEQFSEKEINDIVNSSPGIGFPECCRIFSVSPELQEGRVNFFKHPSRYMKDIIKEKFNEDQQKALLYLLLSNTNVTTRQLDIENENVDESTIEKVFNIFLPRNFPGNLDLSFSKKKSLVKKGLESLCDSFVRKEKGTYQFFHDSIRDAVAILYGEVTPQGFLKNCNSECLCYLVTSQYQDTTCKIVVDYDIFECVYTRILAELKSGSCEKFSIVSSLILWNDDEFLIGFLEWMDEQESVPVDFHFKWMAGNANLGDQKDSDFDIEDEDNQSSFFVFVAKVNSHRLLKRLMDRNSASEGQMKKALDVALAAGSVKCAALLLEVKVKPDSDSCFSVVEGGKLDLLVMLEKYDIIQTSRAERSKSLYKFRDVNVLHEACLFQQMDMVCRLLEKYPSLLHQKGKYGYGTLHFVARTGNTSLYKLVEKLILDNKVGVECLFIKSLTDVDKETVLHLACVSGSTELCAYLCGTYPSLLLQRDKHGRHCLHYAAMSGCVDCYKLIAGWTLRDIQPEKCGHFMESLTDDRYRRTVLHWACESGNKDLCSYLCQEYPSLLLQQDKNGLHCLHFAAVSCDVECFKLLEAFVLEGKSGFECEHYMDTLTNTDERTVLHVACQSGNRGVYLYLCDTYPSLLSQTDKNGRHCLHYAAECDNVEFYKAVESLVLAGKTRKECEHFMTTQTSRFNGTVLHRACWFGSKHICMYLCNKYPSLLSQRDKHGMHCIHYTAMSWNLDCYKAVEALVMQEALSKGNTNYIQTLLTDRGSSVLDFVNGAVEDHEKDLYIYLMKSGLSSNTHKFRKTSCSSTN